MASDDLYDEMQSILALVGDRINAPTVDATLLRLHSNATFVLPSVQLVVRIATNPGKLNSVTASVAITRWLAGRGFPCVEPADIDEQPLVIHGRIVSLWRYMPVMAGPAPTGAELGRILRTLHDQPVPPHQPDRLDDPLRSVANAIEEVPEAMPDVHRAFLKERIAWLRDQWAAMSFPHPPGLIHGDAHISNLMRTEDGTAILGDWDHVAIGPREWDLVQIHFMRRRFGRATEEDIEAFTKAYGWDMREWPGIETLDLVREVTGLSPYIRTAPTKEFSRQQLAYRLDTLRRGDSAARWSSAPNE